MSIEDAGTGAREGFEISSRFRVLIEERIDRLEKDADDDEAQLAHLDNDDHIRRQKRLVAIQRAEARRMRHFLDSSGTRIPPPLMTL
jgi:hypothetical protein